MTNEEAIETLRLQRIFTNTSNINVEAIDTAIESLEENAKLKAEIKQLKSELERYKKLIPKMCENCEYEDLLGYEEPCERCFLYSKWKLKCEESNE
jgi:hypothetical protein